MGHRALHAVSLSAIVAAITGGVAFTVACGVKARSSQLFGPSVWRGPTDRRSVALTFDDGPSPGTMELLAYLAQQNVRATFFQCGVNVRRHPEIARAVQAAGHEIGNHTFSHRRLCPRIGWKLNILSRRDVFNEFAQTQQALHDLGIHPALLRAPYGLRWFGLRDTQRTLGLLGVMWTVIGHDWEWTSSEVAQLILRKATPGAILCLHDGRDIRADPDISTTLRAVEQIVPALKQRGYIFDTVSDLIQSGRQR